MTPQQYTGLFIRLFAVWLFFLAVQTVGLGVALDVSGPAHGRTLEPYLMAGLYNAYRSRDIVVLSDVRRRQVGAAL